MRTLAFLSLLLLAMSAHAQNAAPSWLENTLYGNGKLNTVLIVVSVIIVGIGFWMFTMDRRIKRMEERMKK
ncbi:MAG: CcmD family protein [Flavobacteriales bacterium]